MNDTEWLACTNAESMVDFLRDKASERKFRLFAIACCRRVWHWFDNDEVSRKAVEVAERYADGRASDQELVDANQAPGQSGSVTYQTTVPNAGDGAFGAAYCIADAMSNCVPLEEVESAYKAESFEQSRLAHCIFGNPLHPVTLHPSWLTPKSIKLAQGIYDDRAFDRLPALADALEDAGCNDAEMLAHCRQPGEHVRGCWVVDLLLGKV